MRRLTSPTGLLLIILFLSLIFTNAVLAFECTNAGAGNTAPDDGGVGSNTACGNAAVVSSIGASTAVGGSATAAGDVSTAVGQAATASGSSSTALGSTAEASGGGSTALGQGAVASASHSTALGAQTDAEGVRSIAVGVSALATGTDDTVVGSFATIFSSHSNATALGAWARVEQSNAMVLGSIPGLNGGTEYVDVGIGTSMPQAPLHIRREDDTFEFMFLESDAAGGAQDRAMMQLNNNGGIRFQFDNVALGTAWRFQAATGNQDNFEITKVGTGALEMRLDGTGNLTIQGTLTQNSDVNAKRDIEATDGQLILAKLDTLPVAEWTYKRDGSGARHLGPMAQDFHAAFGLGEDETKIAPGDMAGVNMAAIKALAKENQDLRERLESLENMVRGMIEHE